MPFTSIMNCAFKIERQIQYKSVAVHDKIVESMLLMEVIVWSNIHSCTKIWNADHCGMMRIAAEF